MQSIRHNKIDWKSHRRRNHCLVTRRGSTRTHDNSPNRVERNEKSIQRTDGYRMESSITRADQQTVGLHDKSRHRYEYAHETARDIRNVGKNLITIAFRASLKIWEEQNLLGHGHSKEESRTILKTKLMTQVERIQQTTTLDNVMDEKYCQLQLEQIQNMPTDQIMACIRNMKTLTKICETRRADAKALAHTRDSIPDLQIGNRDVQSGLRASTREYGSRSIYQ